MAARALLSARRCVELSPTWPKVRSAMPMALLFAISSFIGAATGFVARWLHTWNSGLPAACGGRVRSGQHERQEGEKENDAVPHPNPPESTHNQPRALLALDPETANIQGQSYWSGHSHVGYSTQPTQPTAPAAITWGVLRRCAVMVGVTRRTTLRKTRPRRRLPVTPHTVPNSAAGFIRAFASAAM